MVKNAVTQRAADEWILRRFGALSAPEQNPAHEVFSTPAHPQVTYTVGQR